MSNRIIAHLDLDSFFVNAEKLRSPGLKNKPVVVGGLSGRSVVCSASYEARAWGVRSAMPVSLARRLCPELVVVRGDFEYYNRLSSAVTEIVASKSPLWEKASIDEFYMDFTGMDKYLGAWRWLIELTWLIERETGLSVSAGLATSKTVGKVATRQGKPHGRLRVDPGTEKSFLSPLPVNVLPGAGARMGDRLAAMGVRYISILQSLPRSLMTHLFGKSGEEIWLKAHGIDNSPVNTAREAKSFSQEITFVEDTDDSVLLDRTLSVMAEQLGYRLRKNNMVCGTLTLKLRYADFDTSTRQQKISYTACDVTLLRVARDLLKKSWTRRQRIRLLGLRTNDMVYGHYQMHLFEDKSKEFRLNKAIDSLNTRFGSGTVSRASSILK